MISHGSKAILLSEQDRGFHISCETCYDTFRNAITRFDTFAQEHLIPRDREFVFVTLNFWDLRVPRHRLRHGRHRLDLSSVGQGSEACSACLLMQAMCVLLLELAFEGTHIPGVGETFFRTFRSLYVGFVRCVPPLSTGSSPSADGTNALDEATLDAVSSPCADGTTALDEAAPTSTVATGLVHRSSNSQASRQFLRM
jgi:hypothetical protein